MQYPWFNDFSRFLRRPSKFDRNKVFDEPRPNLTTITKVHDFYWQSERNRKHLKSQPAAPRCFCIVSWPRRSMDPGDLGAVETVNFTQWTCSEKGEDYPISRQSDGHRFLGFTAIRPTRRWITKNNTKRAPMVTGVRGDEIIGSSLSYHLAFFFFFERSWK